MRLILTLLLLMMTGGARAAQEEEFRSLFDGKYPVQWRGFRMPNFPVGKWTIQSGVLKTVPGPDMVDLLSRERFTNFECKVEWRLGPGSQSGISYLFQESLSKSRPDGLRLVLVDDARHEEARLRPENQTGSLYGILGAKRAILKPIGQWNEACIRVLTNHVEHWLNGQKVLEFDLRSPEFKSRVEQSRPHLNVDRLAARGGHFALHHGGGEAAFRNLRVRMLTVPPGETVPDGSEAKKAP